MRGLSSLFPCALLAVVVAATAGCGGPAAPEIRRTDFDVAPNVPAGSPAATHWDWFVKNVRTWSPKFAVQLVRGTIDVTTLGTTRIQVMRADVADLARVAPELAVLALPLLFESEDEADFVLDRHVLPDVRRRLDARGLSLLAWTEGAPRVLYASGPPAATAAPRLATLDAHAAGAGAPADAPAVLLDLGTVPGLVLASNAWFDALPPRDEDALRSAYATREARADTRRVAGELLATLATRATHAVRMLTVEERRAWRAALEPQRRATVAALGAEAASLYAIVERGRADYAAAAGPGGTPEGR